MPDELSAPVYPEIDRAASWFGFQLDDLAVLVFLFWVIQMIVEQAHPHLSRADLSLPLSMAATGAAFALWRSVKANQPRGFLEDAIGLLAEPEVFELTPDTEIRPAYIIEPDGRCTVALPDRSRRAFRSWAPVPAARR